MNVICDKQLLVEAVGNVSRAVSAKNTLAALEGVLLRAQDGRLYLTGYDLELAISTAIEAKVLAPGEIVLSARIFLDMIRRMPSETISITSDEKMLTLIKGSPPSIPSSASRRRNTPSCRRSTRPPRSACRRRRSRT